MSKHWNLRDTHGKFRSRRAFKQDLRQDSQEEWEVRRRKGKGKTKGFLDFGNLKSEL